jgi:hypothetical protein
MRSKVIQTASLLVLLQYTACAVPTWPAPTDELEDLIYLNTGYRSTGLAGAVTPCSKGLTTSRVTAAEWLRTAFHDAISGNIYTGQGGLDGSIAWEIDTLENEGVFADDSVKAWAKYVSDITSLSDVIAAGTYVLTRSCSNISIAVRGGRVDATEAGPLGFVPQPQNAVSIFRNQFARMGLDDQGMVQFVACGHSIGGVHGADHPEITDETIATFDQSPASLDNAIAVEYMSGKTKNPLVVGKSVANKRNSDFKVFDQADDNVTISALASDPTLFANACQSIFQTMIDLVPYDVQLSDPIVPYEAKPYALQLVLLDGGSTIKFTGEIRIRSTQKGVSQVQLAYTDRTGALVQTPISTAAKGTASGFDDSFAFFGFSKDLPADTSISSFTVLVTYSDATQATFDNNGVGFKVQDAVIYQAPQSCLDSSGKLTVVAAVRDVQAALNLEVKIKVPQASPNPVPSISTTTIPMATQSVVGAYQLYSADVSLSSSTDSLLAFGIYGGDSSDTRKGISGLPSSCTALATQIQSSSSALSTSVTSISSSSSVSVSSSSAGVSTSHTSSDSVIPSQSISTSTSDTASVSSSPSSTQSKSSSDITASSTLVSSTPGPTANSAFKGCYYDAANPRALSGKASDNKDMTVEDCAASCTQYQYFGLEYATECYCGNALDSTSTSRSLSDCNMPCGGNSSQSCGGPHRISLYSNSEYSAPVNTNVTGYEYQGCYSEGSNTRALVERSFSEGDMTVENCASLCSGSPYFGVEYGRYVFSSPCN